MPEPWIAMTEQLKRLIHIIKVFSHCILLDFICQSATIKEPEPADE